MLQREIREENQSQDLALVYYKYTLKAYLQQKVKGMILPPKMR